MKTKYISMQSNEYIEICLTHISLYISFIADSYPHVFYGQEI